MRDASEYGDTIMTLPTLRLTVNEAECALLIPGFNLLASGLATARLGSFPRRYPSYLSLLSSVYEGQVFDLTMAQMVLNVRQRLLTPTSSRKFRLNVVELAAVSFALRLRSTGRCREDDPLVIADIKRLATKLEACRKRAKRACISRIGAVEYATEARRWTGFAAWCRFSLCCFELPAFRTRSQARIWREQREQLTKAFSDILSQRIYAQLDDIEMRRMVTLAASALRRGRYPVGLRGLLREPELHGDLLIGFLEKRLQLVELPGHPVSEWKAAVNRTEKFAAYQRQRSSHVTPPSIATLPTPTPTPATVTLPTPAAAQARPKPLIPIQAEPKLPETEPPTAATDAEIVLALAAGLWSGVEPSFLEPVRELVRLQICSGFLLQYKKETKAKNLKTLIDELRPPQPMVIVAYDMWAKDRSLGSHAPFATIATHGADIGWVEFDTAQEPANRYAEWLLGVLMSVRSDPGAILNLAQASLSKFRSLQRRER